ncbi:MAG TPA: 16S rRNA (guanine(966)-N(2))-methyltransferase RsmD [Actinomycetota bacterium]|nr:16S rRNA (guanine(966)-N(2))-methyltransferase RsmD [Actinomycetota bacterium]
MRVIAGSARGRKLKSVDDLGVRPTTDRLKESLFSTLGPGIRGKRVLDLYAGSGGLGIEALSRGAEHATFVESDQSAAAIIDANLATTGLADRAQVIRHKAERFAEGARFGSRNPFDVVLADPPYDTGIPADVLQGLAANGLLAEDAMVVLEVSSRLEDLEPPVGYRLLDARKYGDSRLLYLKQTEGEPEP